MAVIRGQDEAPFLPLELRVSSGDASLVGLGRLIVHRSPGSPMSGAANSIASSSAPGSSVSRRPREIARRGARSSSSNVTAAPAWRRSTHNSGVIHAGLYYPAGSLKAELCVEGAAADVPLLRGTARAARSLRQAGRRARTPRSSAVSRRCRARGTANGVAGLEIVDPAFVVRARAARPRAGALWSPDTGRVDASALVRALLRQAQKRRRDLPARTPRRRRRSAAPAAFEVRLERETIAARTVVNAAGLYADEVSAALGGETLHESIRAAANTRSSSRRGATGSTVSCIRCRTRPVTASACT